MDGATRAAKGRLDLAFWTAWHVELFARLDGRAFDKAFNDRFASDGDTTDALKNAYAIAFFHRLKARGFPVDITRH